MATVALRFNRLNKINSKISLYKIVYTRVKDVSLYCDFLNLDLLAYGILNIYIPLHHFKVPKIFSFVDESIFLKSF